MERIYPFVYMNDVGDRFQRETSYHPDTLKGHTPDLSRRPDRYKSIEAPLEIISLPAPYLPQSVFLWTAISERRSQRQFRKEKTLKLDFLSTLLWASQGITGRLGDILLRATPSAGALYAVETYLYARAVHGLENGFYHFRPMAFDLEFIREGDYTDALYEAALNQAMLKKAQVTFIWSAIVERAKWKYKQRAYRYIYLDAGHIAQNLYLASEGLGLGACVIGSFFDENVNCLIGVDGISETTVYMAAVGWPEE
jgi:SagB-type dehydrogenase family enzyme